ncbi:Hypothetical protein R9X50_00125300 [Acrodontium crateriforme]|uniref:Acyl-coenzyme A diphosphatase SCS3 n=1 Tax=Acrodontium crateriforme TaxID=150365 RepID=A0AAQ3M1R0_9PEZI|nr:Hypothetical protein R9X50_00125300 [Acrodontium crateriforme]
MLNVHLLFLHGSWQPTSPAAFATSSKATTNLPHSAKLCCHSHSCHSCPRFFLSAHLLDYTSFETMTARRTRTTFEVPISSPNNTSSPKPATSSAPSATLDTPTSSPFLPTRIEAALLGLYPVTLFLGSLFSTLHPSTRGAVYSATSQSYDPSQAPSYFAKKSNVFNIYFVKIGWFWITLSFVMILLSHPALGQPFRPTLTKRRLQAALRWASVTAVWIFVTQWFFGPAIIDRSFRWTGGQCEIFNDPAVKNTLGAEMEKDAMNDVREVFTHAACKAVGGQWAGGHDISGHVFLLILGSATLWLEVLPSFLRKSGLREARRILTQDGLVQTPGIENTESEVPSDSNIGIGAKLALVIAALSWWMLLMTAAYFHTWFEKFTGFIVAITTVYAVYFLPRAVPALRNVLGMPVA